MSEVLVEKEEEIAKVTIFFKIHNKEYVSWVMVEDEDHEYTRVRDIRQNDRRFPERFFHIPKGIRLVRKTRDFGYVRSAKSGGKTGHYLGARTVKSREVFCCEGDLDVIRRRVRRIRTNPGGLY